MNTIKPFNKDIEIYNSKPKYDPLSIVIENYTFTIMYKFIEENGGDRFVICMKSYDHISKEEVYFYLHKSKSKLNLWCTYIKVGGSICNEFPETLVHFTLQNFINLCIDKNIIPDKYKISNMNYSVRNVWSHTSEPSRKVHRDLTIDLKTHDVKNNKYIAEYIRYNKDNELYIKGSINSIKLDQNMVLYYMYYDIRISGLDILRNQYAPIILLENENINITQFGVYNKYIYDVKKENLGKYTLDVMDYYGKYIPDKYKDLFPFAQIKYTKYETKYIKYKTKYIKLRKILNLQ